MPRLQAPQTGNCAHQHHHPHFPVPKQLVEHLPEAVAHRGPSLLESERLHMEHDLKRLNVLFW